MAKLPGIIFLLCVFSIVPLGASGPKFSKVPDGWLSDTVYTNEALGIKFQIPDGWATKTDGEIPAGFDFHPLKEPARQCVKVLVSYAMTNSIHSDYKSRGLLFVLDPGCFPGAKFPRTLDRGEVREFAGKMIHSFSGSPYIGPDGADVGCLQKENLIFVLLTGEDTVRLGAGASLHENILFALTEFDGYWIGWGSRADDERTEQLKSMTDNIKFWIGPKNKMP